MNYCSTGYRGNKVIFVKRSQNIARKEHNCCECKETIQIGDKYILSKGKWKQKETEESYFRTYRTCLFCDGVSNDLQGYGHSIAFTVLWHFIANCLEDNDAPDISM
ncbi:MAG: hypothetical protein HQK79_22960 [Desulfobacterales bacterium]|nr:hypothetical protein [Desulfobacterales bacterium]